MRWECAINFIDLLIFYEQIIRCNLPMRILRWNPKLRIRIIESIACAPNRIYVSRKMLLRVHSDARHAHNTWHAALSTARIETTMVSLWHTRRPPCMFLSNEIPCCHTPQTTEIYEIYGKNFAKTCDRCLRKRDRAVRFRWWSLKIVHTISNIDNHPYFRLIIL